MPIFEYITVSNCIINGANRGLNIILRDGGSVRNVLFSNLTIRTERKETFWWGNGDPVWFTIQKRGVIPASGIIENVTLQNVIAYGQSESDGGFSNG
nr:CAZy families GH28 protein [uncultured Faecalibacterium sp.]